jgi:hypothetical protein
MMSMEEANKGDRSIFTQLNLYHSDFRENIEKWWNWDHCTSAPQQIEPKE